MSDKCDVAGCKNKGTKMLLAIKDNRPYSAFVCVKHSNPKTIEVKFQKARKKK